MSNLATVCDRLLNHDGYLIRTGFDRQAGVDTYQISVVVKSNAYEKLLRGI
jgi:hypothetical protein